MKKSFMKKSLLVCIFHCSLLLNVSSIFSARASGNDASTNAFDYGGGDDADLTPIVDVVNTDLLVTFDINHINYLISNRYDEAPDLDNECMHRDGHIPRKDLLQKIVAYQKNLIVMHPLLQAHLEAHQKNLKEKHQLEETAKIAASKRNHIIVEGAQNISLSALFNLLIVPVITDSVPNLNERFFNKNHCASMISTGAATAVKEIHRMKGSPSMNKTIQMGTNVAIDTGSQYVGMQAVSVIVSGINHFKNDPIDENSNAILNIQKITGIVLAGTVGTMLKKELSDGYFQRQKLPGQKLPGQDKQE